MVSGAGLAASFWSSLSSEAHLAIKYAFYAFDVSSTGLSVFESYLNGNTAQAGFRAALGFGIFRLLGYIPTCFIAGTKVLVRDSTDPASVAVKNIEDIRVGEFDWAREEAGELAGWKPVQETYQRYADHLRIVEIESSNGTRQTLKTTNEHPFWVNGRGWVHAATLSAGDALSHPNNEQATVARTSVEPHPEGIAVYNLKVEAYHSYYVAETTQREAILVHNASYGEILAAVKAGGNTADEANSLEEGLHAVKRALDDLSPGKAKFRGVAEAGTEYSSTAGVSKWFRIEPAETWVGNNLPHIKFQDNATGNSGHVWISQSEYDSLVANDEGLLAIVLKYFE